MMNRRRLFLCDLPDGRSYKYTMAEKLTPERCSNLIGPIVRSFVFKNEAKSRVVYLPCRLLGLG